MLAGTQKHWSDRTSSSAESHSKMLLDGDLEDRDVYARCSNQAAAAEDNQAMAAAAEDNQAMMQLDGCNNQDAVIDVVVQVVDGDVVHLLPIVTHMG